MFPGHHREPGGTAPPSSAGPIPTRAAPGDSTAGSQDRAVLFIEPARSPSLLPV